jgi:hypothetical protein
MPRPLSDAITRIETLAGGQFGLFAGRQALAVGVTRAMLRHHAGIGGRWVRILHDVFYLPTADPVWQQPHMAAQLQLPGCPPLSHRAAAAILGLDGVDRWVAPPEFLVLRGRGHTADRWLMHQRQNQPNDVMFTGPLRHTGPLQTFADLVTIESKKLLEYRVESGLRLGVVTEEQLWALATSYGLKDEGRLQFVLRQRGRGTPPTGSNLETVAVRVVRTCEVTPTAIRQYPVVIDGRIVFYLDLAWPEIRLYAEVDGRAFHDIDDASFHHDRRRQREMTALGWQRVPLTARDLLRSPSATARDLDRCYITRASELGVAV